MLHVLLISFMMPTRFKPLQKILPQAILLITLLSLYLRTMAPGLTWVNGGSDGGDLITAAATGGIAHPSGYPLYLLLARLFQCLPIGSLAFRTNLMSALFTSLAAAFVFHIVTSSVPKHEYSHPWLAGLVAAFAFGLAPLVWSQAVITEVYALQSFLIVLIIYLYTIPMSSFRTKSNGLDRWRGLVLGLAASNHITSILIVPMALVLGCIPGQSESTESSRSALPGFLDIHFNFASLGRQFFWFGIGLSFYLLLPLRALASPPINWGNPVTVERFWWLVTGQLYQSYYLQFGLPEFWEHIQAGASLLLKQFGLTGIIIGMVGWAAYNSRTRVFVLTNWIAIVFAALAFLYRSQDSYLYLTPTFLCFAIWAGLGTSALTNRFDSHIPIFKIGLSLFMVAYFVVRALTALGDVDASRDLKAESFGKEILVSAPRDAIIFAQGDAAVFTLWYFHFALGERPDLAIVAVDLLHFDWYQENLHSVYPSLEIPGPFPWPETIAGMNHSRAACHIRSSSQIEMNCSQPVLTH